MRRRSVLAGLGAAALVPRPSWADALDPLFLSAAKRADGSYHLCGLSDAGEVLFHLPLPDRGHAAAAHPTRPEAVAFARRPGRYAIIIDCARGLEVARLTPPEDRHFYGHGAFSADGSVLFTTENDLETLDGRIGLWDVRDGYRRIGDIASGGVGPHEIKRLPGSDVLVVANGGIATHPESGRTPLNLATMRANLAFVDPDGTLRDVQELDYGLRQNSIRHLAIRADGLVAAGLQWNGASGAQPPLLLLTREGASPRHAQASPELHRQMQGYVGSVSFGAAGRAVAITSPRGALVQVFDADTGAFRDAHTLPDVCGVAALDQAFFVTTGLGAAGPLGRVSEPMSPWMWDNHLISLETI